MKRRDFLKASGISTGALLLDGCRRREARLFRQSVAPGPALAGEAVWRPGVCGQCSAGCGTRVRLIEGAAKKIEGQPGHPVNQGGLCALGQSALQELYNPDRILQPMRRLPGAGVELGASAFETISWQEALDSVGRALATARQSGPGKVTILAAGDDTRQALWRRFAAALGEPTGTTDNAVFPWRPADEEVERQAAFRVFGWHCLPYYQLAESDLVLGLGAAFLDRWRSPVHYARALADQRESRRSRLIHAEARMSLTAAAADRWLPVRPGTEGTLARALSGALLESDAIDSDAVGRYRALFPATPPTLEQAAERCDLSLAHLQSLVRELAIAKRPVVIAGGSAALYRHGLASVAAGMALNLLLGAVGRSGGIFEGSGFDLGSVLEPDPGNTDGASSRPLRSDLGRRLEQAELVLIADCDPVRDLSSSQRALLGSGPHGRRTVVLTSFFDQSALSADLVLPIQTDLERFDLVAPSPGPRHTTIGLSPGIVESRGEARHPVDVVLALAATQDALVVDMPWQGNDKLIQAILGAQAGQLPGASGLTPARYLRQLRAQGGAWSTTTEDSMSSAPEIEDLVAFDQPFDSERSTSPPADTLTLIPFESVKTGDGRGANRPWLQELPDPMSSVMWGSWVEIAPSDALRLGLETGDVVQVVGAGQRPDDGHGGGQRAWVFVSPAARPGTLALPLGQGHHDLGRYARSRGVNPFDLLVDQTVEGVGVGALGEVEVTVRKVDGESHAPIYGRGLRQAEAIPRGWAPQDSNGSSDLLIQQPDKKEPT